MIVSMIAGTIVYIVYMFFNAWCIKTAIDWGFEHNIGWGSAIIFSFVTSIYKEHDFCLRRATGQAIGTLRRNSCSYFALTWQEIAWNFGDMTLTSMY